MINKILNHRSETILGGGLILALFAFLSSLFGMLRDALLAAKIGASSTLDIYYASFRLPDFIYNILILGAISAGFIPLFVSYLTESKEKANQLINGVLTFFGLFIGLLALLLTIFCRPILSLLLAGFDSQKIELAIKLTRILMIQPLFLGLSSIIGAVLQSHRLFLVNALAPLMYNLGIIVGILFFYPAFGLVGLAEGVVLGAILNFLIQVPSFRNLGYKISLGFSKIGPGLFSLVAMMVPRSLTILINQGYLLVLTFVASYLKEGSLAVFNLANNIQNLPQTIFALSLATSVFPVLSHYFHLKDMKNYYQTLIKTIRQTLFFIIPISAFFIVFRAQIVRLLLGYGRFDWSATILTIEVLTIFLIGMVFQSLINLLIRGFFSQKNTFTPFLAALSAYGLGTLAALWFGFHWGIKGLAWAFVLTNTSYALILIILLFRFYNFYQEIFLFLLKIGAISFAAALTSYAGLRLNALFLSTHTVLGLAVQTFLALIFGLIVFYLLAKKLKLEELSALNEIFKKYLRKGNV